MRGAVFVAVVLAHVILILLLSWPSRQPTPQSVHEETITPIFLPPLAPQPFAPLAAGSPWQAPLLYRSTVGSSGSRHLPPRILEDSLALHGRRSPESRQQGQMLSEQQLPAEQAHAQRGIVTPDWRAQAELTAESSAQQIVAAEDAAERRAKALTSRFKPLPPPRVPGPQFGWDYAPTHRIVMNGGGFVYTINDHCQLVFLVVVFVGCTVGTLPVNGELFKDMHPPVKYGDWDWRDKDP